MSAAFPLPAVVLAPRGEGSNGKCGHCGGSGLARWSGNTDCEPCTGTGLAEHCMTCGAAPGDPCANRCGVAGALSCDKPRRHPSHTWRYDGELVACDGTPAEVQGRCCSDPLCPCGYKRGWGAYAAPTFSLAGGADDAE